VEITSINVSSQSVSVASRVGVLCPVRAEIRAAGHARADSSVRCARRCQVGPDGRNLEERLVGVLIQEALKRRQRLAAVAVIFDRLEGRAHQFVRVADVTTELHQKSDLELSALRLVPCCCRWLRNDSRSFSSGACR
jgi:hypothetical protein